MKQKILISIIMTLLEVVFFTFPLKGEAHRITATGFGFTATSESTGADDDKQGMKKITETVENTTNNDTTFRWTAPIGGNVLDELVFGGPIAKKSKETNTWETIFPVIEVAGQFSIGNQGTGGQFLARAHREGPPKVKLLPPQMPPAGQQEKLNSKLSETPDQSMETDLLNFTSFIISISPGLFEYRYEVTSSLDTLIAFNWTSAGLQGSVSASSPFVSSFVSSALAAEFAAGASFNLRGTDTSIIAPAFQPIPEPSTLLLLGAGLTILLVYRVYAKSNWISFWDTPGGGAIMKF